MYKNEHLFAVAGSFRTAMQNMEVVSEDDFSHRATHVCDACVLKSEHECRGINYCVVNYADYD